MGITFQLATSVDKDRVLEFVISTSIGCRHFVMVEVGKPAIKQGNGSTLQSQF